MRGKLKYMLIFFVGLIFTDISAQNSQVMYYMNLPQNHILNPALRPSNSLYIGLPGISGVNVNVNNNFVNFSDVFMKGKGFDSVISILHPDYNIDKFLAKIRDKNSIEPEISVQLFGLGFALGESSWLFLDINDRVDGNLVIPGDLIKLAFKGNEGFVGSQIDLSSLRGDMKYYREVGLGFSRDFTSRLRLGVKGKLLFGIATASIKNNALGITVNDDYSHTFNADITANFSAPLIFKRDAENNLSSIVFDDKRFNNGNGVASFITGSKNIGLGIDLGATYALTEQIIVSASITDLGFIRWKKDVTNLKTKNQFVFSGLNMLDVVNGTKTLDEVGQEMVDSLKNSFKQVQTNKPFTTSIPFGLTFGGSYSLTRSVSFGLLSYSRFIGKQVRESITLSANLNVGNLVSTSLSYTAENHMFNNFGAGIAFRPGIFQFYIITDRLPLSWNKIRYESTERSLSGTENKTQKTMILPNNWNTFNLRVGMNLAFGNGLRKKNDKPMILVE
jgi:hypothetical protein